jgi:hypothetical protein
MNKDEALKMAIEAISYQDSLSPDDSSTDWNCSRNELKKALDACILALEQPTEQQKAFIDEVKYGQSFMIDGNHVPIDSFNK